MDDSCMLQDESDTHSSLGQRYSLLFETGGLFFPPIYHSSNGQVMGLGETFKFVMGLGH